MPVVSLGPPVAAHDFLQADVNGVIVYYNRELSVRPGHMKVTIRLKKLFCWSWLELEGAKSFPKIEK